MIDSANNKSASSKDKLFRNKFLFLPIILIAFISTIFSLSKNWIFKNDITGNKSVTINSDDKTVSSTTPTNQSPTPKNTFFKLATLSSDPTVYAYIKQATEVQEVQLIISSSNGLRVMNQGEQVQFIYTEVVSSNEYLENLNTEVKKVLAWSNDDSKLAILVPNKVIVFTLEWSSIKETYWDGSQGEVRVAEIASSTDYPVSATVANIMFSGDGSELYVGNEYVVDLNKGQVNNIPGRLSDNYYGNGRIFPIPNSNGIVYWEDTSESQPDIVKNVQGNLTKYQLPEGSYDYDGNIILSPDNKYICLDYGVSGYWGYLVGRIEGNRLIKLVDGKQYSYCMKWLNNQEVLLQEIPYSAYGNYYYSYNILTGEKEFLFERNTHSER